ncbi:MAG TPA: 23S rRNA (guanosine(2251)-2'-O)-methyltransferase RlmB, partial [Lachnospiraceae bacterium]|nr:23S rRNA (guanosine(2251)-2'-O)-methyltransferase RlmB [Lachnospiraceae bacterium]
MKQKTVISSSSNAQVKNLNLLQKKARVREEQGIFVVEGRKMFEEARESGLLVKTYACESFYREKLQEDGGYFQNLDYEVITDALFKEISETKTPQGIMGVVKKSVYSLEDILKEPDPLLLLLEDIRDPGNL